MKKDISSNNYDLYKEIEVEEVVDYVDFAFSSSETSKLEAETYHLEIELTRNTVVETVYRETLTVLEDVIKNE